MGRTKQPHHTERAQEGKALSIDRQEERDDHQHVDNAEHPRQERKGIRRDVKAGEEVAQDIRPESAFKPIYGWMLVKKAGKNQKGQCRDIETEQRVAEAVGLNTVSFIKMQ